jgi:uncharacterized protein YgfB (UPF0149 family)
VLCVVVSSLGTWRVTADYKDNKWSAVVAEQSIAASKALLAATTRTSEIERTYSAIATDLEAKAIETSRLLNKELATNRTLARKLRGLRDPFAKSTCRGSVPGTSHPTGPTGDSSAEGRLSDEASEFLLNFARDADTAAQYANTCHQWVKGINGTR